MIVKDLPGQLTKRSVQTTGHAHPQREARIESICDRIYSKFHALCGPGGRRTLTMCIIEAKQTEYILYSIIYFP